jgi:hypothetical protein
MGAPETTRRQKLAAIFGFGASRQGKHIERKRSAVSERVSAPQALQQAEDRRIVVLQQASSPALPTTAAVAKAAQAGAFKSSVDELNNMSTTDINNININNNNNNFNSSSTDTTKENHEKMTITAIINNAAASPSVPITPSAADLRDRLSQTLVISNNNNIAAAAAAAAAAATATGATGATATISEPRRDVRFSKRALDLFTCRPFTLPEKIARWATDLAIGEPAGDPPFTSPNDDSYYNKRLSSSDPFFSYDDHVIRKAHAMQQARKTMV